MKSARSAFAAAATLVLLGTVNPARADIILDSASRSIFASIGTGTSATNDSSGSVLTGLFNASASRARSGSNASSSMDSFLAHTLDSLSISVQANTAASAGGEIALGRANLDVFFTLTERSRYDLVDASLTSTGGFNLLSLFEVSVASPVFSYAGQNADASATGFLDPGSYQFRIFMQSVSTGFSNQSSGVDFDFSVTPDPVPAPAAALLAMIGLPLVDLVRRRF